MPEGQELWRDLLRQQGVSLYDARSVAHAHARRCISYNCKDDGTCGRAADEPIHPATWVYAVIGVGIVLRESAEPYPAASANASQ